MILRVLPAPGPLAGALGVPGDKSIGHRSIIFAALGTGTSRVHGLSGGEDNARTVQIFRDLGIDLDASADEICVHGRGVFGPIPTAKPLDCGNSGTTMRLLCGLLTGVSGTSLLVGDEYLHKRPMRRVTEPLLQMGARIEGVTGASPTDIYPPLRIHGGGPLRGLDHSTRVASAQVKSALLLAGLFAEGPVRICEPRPSRDHTERMMAARGVPIQWSVGTAELDPRGWDRRLAPLDVEIPGDPSAAAFFAVAAAIVSGSDLLIRNVCVNPTRTGFLDVLMRMGACIEMQCPRDLGGEPVADLRVRSSALRATDIEGDVVVRALDEIPILAVAAAQADGVTHIRDAGELRVKESDRIRYTREMLQALGVTVSETEEGLIIEGLAGKRFAPARIASGGDHRIAMSAAVAALAGSGECAIDDAANIKTSFPDFVDVMQQAGAELREDPA